MGRRRHSAADLFVDRRKFLNVVVREQKRAAETALIAFVFRLLESNADAAASFGNEIARSLLARAGLLQHLQHFRDDQRTWQCVADDTAGTGDVDPDWLTG